MILYDVLKRLIEKNEVNGLSEKLDVFYAVGKLTNEQYEALVEMLKDNIFRITG